jgi:hypothetical protein
MFVSHRIKCVPFQVAKLTKFHSIEFRCGDLSYPGPCGSHPCMNGAKCIENDSSYTCSCRDASSGSRSSASRSSGSRFSGSHCETDTDPCASNPCLYGAECSRNLDSSDYICSTDATATRIPVKMGESARRGMTGQSASAGGSLVSGCRKLVIIFETISSNS